MSRLKLYSPDEVVLPFSQETEDTRFSSSRTSCRIPVGGDSMIDVLIRAQTIRDNRQCIDCGHPIVELLELNDGTFNRNGMPIPGTATLVGFRCASCNAEWPA
ncbi:MAG TPA: hypothetical protein VMM56_07340 [Planctomycetaceae bacterium]|nr:hypothetical protein [Planctomycetaceae bacterium]